MKNYYTVQHNVTNAIGGTISHRRFETEEAAQEWADRMNNLTDGRYGFKVIKIQIKD